MIKDMSVYDIGLVVKLIMHHITRKIVTQKVNNNKTKTSCCFDAYI